MVRGGGGERGAYDMYSEVGLECSIRWGTGIFTEAPHCRRHEQRCVQGGVVQVHQQRGVRVVSQDPVQGFSGEQISKIGLLVNIGHSILH